MKRRRMSGTQRSFYKKESLTEIMIEESQFYQREDVMGMLKEGETISIREKS